MNETQAEAVAAAYRGDVWNSGGGMYLVIFRRTDGRVVAINGKSVCVYADDEALQTEPPLESVLLR